MRVLAGANARTFTASKLNQELTVASGTLNQRARELLEAENLADMNHTVHTFLLEDLGHGRSRGGGASGHKRRLNVLDRLARLGRGLSPAQRNDSSWWTDSWDANMLGERGDEWPNVFAEWVQRVLTDCEGGSGNAFPVSQH